MEIQHLLVVDPSGGHELVDLPHPPADPTSFTELVAVLGPDREVEPAGPPLRAPGHALHRVRGRAGAHAPRVPDELVTMVAVALDQEAGGPVPVERPAWCRPGWAEQTAAWVDDVLAQRGAHRTGRVTVVKSWGLSHVERIPTSEGAVYLKACSALFAHEPTTTAWLAGLAVGVVPGVLAVDQARACMLMEALPPARGALSLEEQRVATCTAMTQVQGAAAGRSEELRAIGAPDRGLSSTARELTDMLREEMSAGQLDDRRRRELEEGVERALGLLEELADCGLPDDALVHGDLHPDNVVVTSEGAVVFDWSDACLGHLVLDLAHLCADRPRTGRLELDWDAPSVQAYLQPWLEGYAESALRRALQFADAADLAFQAVTYQRIQASLEPDARHDLAGAAQQALGALVDHLPA